MIIVVFSASVKKLYGEVMIDAALYNLDKSCITDFTVEGEITKDLYEDFKSNSSSGSIQELKESLSDRIRSDL